MSAPRRHTRSHLLGGAIAMAWAACVVILAFACVVILLSAVVAVLR
jgi:hypothetical protein